MAAGRPPNFKDINELNKSIEEYFNKNPNKPTITGLAYHLGFASRQSFYDYENNEQFSYTIKRARLRVENCYESKLHETTNAGAIFALKNFGWKDQTDHNNFGELTIKVIHE